MKCFDCGKKMECEDGRTPKGKPLNVIYHCPDCGGEWVWCRGEKMLQVGRSVLGVDTLMSRLKLVGLEELENDTYAETPPISVSEDA